VTSVKQRYVRCKNTKKKTVAVKPREKKQKNKTAVEKRNTLNITPQQKTTPKTPFQKHKERKKKVIQG
jgi:hypothetical protein